MPHDISQASEKLNKSERYSKRIQSGTQKGSEGPAAGFCMMKQNAADQEKSGHMKCVYNVENRAALPDMSYNDQYN